jgi:glycine/D-amino acid oxidase-like deaminating enzyme
VAWLEPLARADFDIQIIGADRVGPTVEAVDPATTMPRSADVVVIGGGIIGTSAALSLAERGIATVLCEKGHVAGEQSSRNWGWCRRMGRDPRELPLIVEAMKLWETMSARLGEDVGFRRSGVLYLCESDADAAGREAWLKVAGDYALDTRMITGAELHSFLPGAARTFRAALYTASDGRAEPQKAAPAIARAAARAGASILTACAVRGIETSAGRVSGVVTEKGRIACSSVILAGGVWSSRLCRSLGVRLPQLGVRASVFRTAPVDGGPETAAWAPGFALRKRLDGGYTIANGSANRYDIVPDSFRYFRDFIPVLKIERAHVQLRLGAEFFKALRMPGNSGPDRPSAFERLRVVDPAPVDGHLAAARAELELVFPLFKTVPTVQSWAGLIDAMPDTVPVISKIDRIPGFFIATGFSGHGFGIGPGAGRLAADLVLGGRPIVDPTPFRYARFIDGTPIRPMTGV